MVLCKKPYDVLQNYTIYDFAASFIEDILD